MLFMDALLLLSVKYVSTVHLKMRKQNIYTQAKIRKVQLEE